MRIPIPHFHLRETPDADIIGVARTADVAPVCPQGCCRFVYLDAVCRWVLRKVEAIVREEMNRAGAVEVFMPSVQPAELWQESRALGSFRRSCCVSVTVMTVIFVMGRPMRKSSPTSRREISSYKQLPINFYQI
ncbi:MAG: hypothetical protein R3E89_16205 [Thiolinea sp.]